MAFKHKSVLLEETVDGLAIKPDGIYVDGTLGGGGHAFEVCCRLNETGEIYRYRSRCSSNRSCKRKIT